MTRRIGKRQTIQWLGEQGKDRQYNGQENREKTDNTMTRRIGKRQTIQWLGEQGKGQTMFDKALHRKLKRQVNTLPDGVMIFKPYRPL